jgi:hypothetical protein
VKVQWNKIKRYEELELRDQGKIERPDTIRKISVMQRMIWSGKHEIWSKKRTEEVADHKIQS